MKKIGASLVFLLLACSLMAQEKMKKRDQQKTKEKEEVADSSSVKAKNTKEGGFDWKKVRVGGNLGAAFGSFTYLQVSPIVGYAFNEKFFGGIGSTYIYQSEKVYGIKYEQNIYGFSLLGRYSLYEGIFLATEYEALNYERYNPYLYRDERLWAGSMFVGGGYVGSFDDFKGPYILLMYNLNFTTNSPYPSPLVIRLGILF
jgi:hypothetical protein